MKKSILYLLSILSGATLLAGTFSIQASADTTVIVTPSELSVVLPSSYEQYLPLKNPAAVAVSEANIAIADGTTIYVYDKAENTYHLYEHKINADQRLNIVTSMEYSSSDGLLYFTDTSTSVYILDCLSLNVYETRLSCSNFTIDGDSMYYATVTAGSVSISMVNTAILSGGDSISANATQINLISSTATPAMAISDGTLYYAIGNQLYSSTSETVTTLNANGNIQSLAFTAGSSHPFYTDAMGTFYAYESNAYKTYDGAYSSLSPYQGDFYVINGRSILLYDTAHSAFADYEICDSSSGKTRLHNATDIVICDDVIAVADRGNKRVSICNPTTGEVTPFTTVVEPDQLAFTEGKLLVTNGSAVAIYTLSGNEIYTHTSFSGVILGITGVYGKFYLITSNNYHYLIEDDRLTDAGKALDNTAKGLTSDIDGNLYVLYANGNVIEYTEDEFMSSQGSGSAVCKMPTSVTKITTDFAGNVYGVYGNTLYYTNKGTISSYEFQPDGAVFGTGYTANSYAISYTESKLYMLCNNFVLSTNTLRFDNLNDIPVSGADKPIFDLSTSGRTDIFRTAPNSVFIRFDINKLKNSAYFTYLSYSRQSEEKNVVKLGEIANYYVVSVFDSSSRIYTANLVKKDNCTLIPAGSYTGDVTFTDGIAYTTNTVKLYKYPYISDALVLERPNGIVSQSISLPKSTFLKVVETLDFGGKDFNFYCVNVNIGDKTYTGYVPVGYLLPFDGTTPPETKVTYTYIEPGNNTVVFREIGNDMNPLSVSNRRPVAAYGDLDGESVLLLLEDNGTLYEVQISPTFLSGEKMGDFTSAMAIFIILVAAIVILTTFILFRMRKD